MRVFTVRMKKAWFCLCWGLTSQSTIFQSCRDGEESLSPSYPFSAQRRLRSAWASAQSDLRLCWVHTHFISFVISWLIWSGRFSNLTNQHYLQVVKSGILSTKNHVYFFVSTSADSDLYLHNLLLESKNSWKLFRGFAKWWHSNDARNILVRLIYQRPMKHLISLRRFRVMIQFVSQMTLSGLIWQECRM